MPEWEVRANVSRSGHAIAWLRRRGLIAAYVVPGHRGELLALTRAGLACPSLIRVSQHSPNLALYARELDEAGL